MKPARVMLDGQFMGTIEEIGYDTPYVYGRWVPANEEADKKIRALADAESDDAPVVTVEGESPDAFYVSSVEDDEINLRQKAPQAS